MAIVLFDIPSLLFFFFVQMMILQVNANGICHEHSNGDPAIVHEEDCGYSYMEVLRLEKVLFPIATFWKSTIFQRLDTIGHQVVERGFSKKNRNLVVQKQSAHPEAFVKNGILRWWNLVRFWKSENLKT